MAVCATDIPSVTVDCCYTSLEIPVSKQCMTELDPGATEKAASFCCFHRQCEMNCSLGYSVHQVQSNITACHYSRMSSFAQGTHFVGHLLNCHRQRK